VLVTLEHTQYYYNSIMRLIFSLLGFSISASFTAALPIDTNYRRLGDATHLHDAGTVDSHSYMSIYPRVDVPLPFDHPSSSNTGHTDEPPPGYEMCTVCYHDIPSSVIQQICMRCPKYRYCGACPPLFTKPTCPTCRSPLRKCHECPKYATENVCSKISAHNLCKDCRGTDKIEQCRFCDTPTAHTSVGVSSVLPAPPDALGDHRERAVREPREALVREPREAMDRTRALREIREALDRTRAHTFVSDPTVLGPPEPLDRTRASEAAVRERRRALARTRAHTFVSDPTVLGPREPLDRIRASEAAVRERRRARAYTFVSDPTVLGPRSLSPTDRSLARSESGPVRGRITRILMSLNVPASEYSRCHEYSSQ
jgi:hypothetical protein